MFSEYYLSFWALAAALVLLGLQSLIASVVKAAQPGAVPGKIDSQLSHESFVFRTHRTFMNSLENSPFFFGAFVLAILSGADTWWAGLFSWMFVAGRAGHMLCYYLIATERNPSPRSYFFLLALASSWGVLALGVIRLIQW